MPSTALTWPTVLRSSPRLIGNQTLRFSVSHDDRRVGAAARRLALGLGGEEVARVGVLRAREDLVDGRLFDHPALLHHVDALGHLAHDAEVVRDEQHRHAHLALQRFSSSRICAWMVTSSAVVGSSAMSRSGSLASAMAIITRWRWPPESWCG